jgi:glucoamylase
MKDVPLFNISLDVIRDCVVANGAVVAANSDRPDYPRPVQNYRYVWPRDAAFMCVAAHRAGLRNFQEGFFRWLLHRAEGLRDSGLLFQNYHVNGPKRWLGLQIDQNGSILWAVNDFYGGDYPADIRDLVKCLADGILSVWGKGFFSALTQDLWEERYAYPDLKQFHTYSLAACIKGLRCAASLDEAYLKPALEMEAALKKANRSGLVRTAGRLKDAVCDASLLGLVWPFDIYEPHDPLIDRLIGNIERRLVTKGGVRRYEHDYYDGHRQQGIDSRRGGGAWPILHFWLAVVLCLRGEHEKAQVYVDYVLRRIQDCLLPEQIFENDIQEGIKPLGWSHAMYILYSTTALELRSR